MDLLNSMVCILPESMDFPDIFHSTKICNYYGKSKSIELASSKGLYNFNTMDFQILFPPFASRLPNGRRPDLLFSSCSNHSIV